MALAPMDADVRVVRDPKVYLVGRQQVDQASLDSFLDDHGVAWQTDTEVGGERLIEVSGRVCYMSFGSKRRRRTNKDYIGHILEVGHGSVLEHAAWNFIITGVSRSFTHELIRHRAGFGYSQLSQRYVDESSADFVEPDCIAEDPDLHELWLDTIRTSQDAYRKLSAALTEKYADIEDRTLRRKLARQAARSVLPNATETKIFVTANARAARHFVELRANEHAETEIRKVAVQILKLLQKEAPNVFGDYQLKPLSDGTEAAHTTHVKV